MFFSRHSYLEMIIPEQTTTKLCDPIEKLLVVQGKEALCVAVNILIYLLPSLRHCDRKARKDQLKGAGQGVDGMDIAALRLGGDLWQCCCCRSG